MSKVDSYLFATARETICPGGGGGGGWGVSIVRSQEKGLFTVLGAQVSHRMGLGGINEKVAGTIHTLVLGTRISVQGHPQINVSVV